MVTQSGLGVQTVAYCGDFLATAKEVGDVAMVRAGVHENRGTQRKAEESFVALE